MPGLLPIIRSTVTHACDATTPKPRRDQPAPPTDRDEPEPRRGKLPQLAATASSARSPRRIRLAQALRAMHPEGSAPQCRVEPRVIAWRRNARGIGGPFIPSRKSTSRNCADWKPEDFPERAEAKYRPGVAVVNVHDRSSPPGSADPSIALQDWANRSSARAQWPA